MWLVWRSYNCSAIQRISVLGEHGLAGQLGHAGYSRPRDFIKTVRRLIQAVAQFWPKCPAELSPDGTILIVRPARVILSPL
jgi:hypothetical protein